MPLNFKLTFDLPATGSNRLHAEVLLSRMQNWLLDNIDKNDFDIENSFHHAGDIQPYKLLGHMPFINVKANISVLLLFLREEDRNLFQLVWNTELLNFGTRNIKTDNIS